jgi:Xaa-Pro aminopeptidase
MTVPQRLAGLRAAMTAQGWAAFIITGTDPHDSEYVPPRWETRAWISGFTGSAGTVVVTADQAGLWTDGRYFLQAETQLAGSGMTLFREGLPGTPSPLAWLAKTLPRGAVAGVDARSVTWSKLLKWRAETAVAGVAVEAGPDLLDAVWTDRPAPPANPVWDYESPAITPRSAKLAALRQVLKTTGAEACLVTALDDVAWLFNLRGSDVEYAPEFLGWGWVDESTAAVYLKPGAAGALKDLGVEIRPYERFEDDVKAASQRLLVGADRINARLVGLLAEAGVPWIDGSPITAMKAKKSAGELDLVRQAHRKDGVALVEFLAAFDALAATGTLTESAAARELDARRESRGGYRGPSFTAIPGYRENGAVIHYHAEGEGSTIAGRGLFLLDTGAQYTEGTTDVTRTVAVGKPEADEIEDYTLVLKAHVQVSLMPFPVGTRGYMIDALARRALWKTGRNFNHGTGHGVGHFLSVHEGPARLNSEPIPVALEPGMILSNEPGLYRPGRYGIRIENLVTVVPAETTEFASFLKWETLTLCPYDRRLIDVSLLEADERRWIDAYHARVAEELGPLVGAARTWLNDACRPL